jgi:hypothetical protein
MTIASPVMRLGIVVIACLTVLLQAANVAYMLAAGDCDLPSFACPPVSGVSAPTDFSTYMRVAEQILAGDVLSASYLTRQPGYPALLAAAIAMTGEPTPALWAGPVLAALAVVSIMWLTWMLSRSTPATLGSGLLFLMWPAAYQYTPQLITDAVHAFVVVAALAVTWRWRLVERRRLVVPAVVLWACAQSLRPTFAGLALLLPLMLWKRPCTWRYAAYSVVLWAGTLLVPASLVISNTSVHRVATVTDLTGDVVACFTVPRVKAQLGMGDFRALQIECWRHYSAIDDVKTRVASQTRDAAAFFRAHPAASLKSFAREFAAQSLFPLRPYFLGAHAPLYPAAASWLGVKFMVLYWMCALAGLLSLRGDHTGPVLFLIGVFFLVMLPAALSYLVGGRLRLPLDLIAMPFVAIAVARLSGSLAGRMRLAL